MVVWNLAYSKYAIKDAKKLSAAGLKDKAQTLLNILEVPDGHFKFPHLWPVKLPHGRTVRLCRI